MRERKSVFHFGLVLFLVSVAGIASATEIPIIYYHGSQEIDSGWSFVVNAAAQQKYEVDFSVDTANSDMVMVEIVKTFLDPPDSYGVFKPIYIEFKKRTADAVSKIVINDEYVTNNTSTVWADYHMYLMSDTVGSPKAGFDSNEIPNGDQFQTVTYNDYRGYNGLPVQLDFTDGLVPYIPAGDNVFHPGLEGPDNGGRIVIVADPQLEVGRSIKLKEIPTVPEPMTLAMLAMGGLGLIRRKKIS